MDDLREEVLRGISLPEDWNWCRQIIESVSSGVSISDCRLADMPLVYTNPAFEHMTGYSAADVLGKNCRFLQGDDRDQPGLQIIRHALQTGTATSTVIRNYRKDGSLFWNELYLSPIRDREGRLTHFAGIQNDVTRRIELEDKLAYMSQHDMLTGLANRALLMERIDEALHKADANQLLVAVLFLDLDNFKLVNDMFGHEAGDVLLRTVSDRLLAGMRGTETAARLGGDEFVIVLENLRDEAEAQATIQRFRNDIQQSMDVAGQPFLPSVSIGMAVYPRDGRSAEDLLRVSDTAMYLNKHIRHQEPSVASEPPRSAQLYK